MIARYITRDDAQAWRSGTGDPEALYSEFEAGWRAPDEPNRLGLTIVVTCTRVDDLVARTPPRAERDRLQVAYGVAPDQRRTGIASRALERCTHRRSGMDSQWKCIRPLASHKSRRSVTAKRFVEALGRALRRGWVGGHGDTAGRGSVFGKGMCSTKVVIDLAKGEVVLIPADTTDDL